MPREFWSTINDLTTLFTARVVALPLLGLLVFKLYLIAPETLLYALGLAFLTCLTSARWGLHYLASHPKAFSQHYQQLKGQQKDKRR